MVARSVAMPFAWVNRTSFDGKTASFEGSGAEGSGASFEGKGASFESHGKTFEKKDPPWEPTVSVAARASIPIAIGLFRSSGTGTTCRQRECSKSRKAATTPMNFVSG